VRRLAALAITLVLASALAAWPAGASGSALVLTLGLVLIGGSVVGWLFQFLRLPRITGYIIFGALCGPEVANIIGSAVAADLRPINGLAIAIIAFVAGLQINVRRFRPRFGTIVTITTVTFGVAWTLAASAVYFAWPWLPIAPQLAGAERLTAAAITATMLVGVSPAMTLAVVAESRAKGPLVDLASAVVVLMELGVIVLFAIWLDASRAVFDGSQQGAWVLVASIAWQIAGALALGAGLGGVFTLYLRYVGREVTVVLIVVGALLAGLGHQLGFQPILAGLAAGIVVQNFTATAGDVLRTAVTRSAWPVLILFFTAVGISMQIGGLTTIGLAVLVVSGIRVIALAAGARAGAVLARVRTQDSALLWRALMSSAGVTLSLSVVAATEHPGWGATLQTLIIGVVALYEVAGPILFRAALVEANEVDVSSSGLVVVSNREPWIHERAEDGSIRATATPGGVSVALDALMRERGGVWVAHGAGSADRDVVDEHDSVEVPPEHPAYRLRRIWLTPEEEERYYAGFSNSALWPLCHQAHVRPVFRPEDWEGYSSVNARFAEVVAAEAPRGSPVFLNDYHLALVARRLRALRPRIRTALFWHIPWPDVDRMRICPWRREIIEGLLHNDLLAFQVPRDQRHFLDCVTQEVGAGVSGEVVYAGDRQVRVVAIPIGADFDRISTLLSDEGLPAAIEDLRTEFGLGDRIVGIGVDRLDYTKGIPERIAALDRLLDSRPGLAERFRFVQVGVPSRPDVPGYAEISEEVDDHIAVFNRKHGRSTADGPIVYLKRGFPLATLVALYRLADFCVVSSLHDGMNLVAKEFVAARDDLDGVLILSELAGAAQEMGEALIINPYDELGFAAAIGHALDMPPWERHRRMRALRRRVAGRDVLAWASDILDRLEERKGPGFLSG
jgi:trehalose 6-phosphate synthase